MTNRSPIPSSPAARDWRGYAAAVGVTVLATAVGWPLHHGFRGPDESVAPLLENSNVLMLYLLGVLWVATRHSRSAAVLASVLGVAAFDACFVPPYLTLAVRHPQYLVTFGVMLLAALTIGTLTHRVRQQAASARQRERRTESLLAFSRDLAAAPTSDEIVAATERHARAVLGPDTVLMLAGANGRPALAPGRDHPGGPPGLTPRALVAAAAAFDRARPADVAAADDVGGGKGGGGSAGTFFPLVGTRGSLGVLGVLHDPDAPAPPEARHLGEAFASQAAVAMERAALADEARQAWERVEAEFLRNTLLSGVSHDLRTPLSAITGAVSALIEAGDALPADARRQMLRTTYAEAERMERLIRNLLDMTRLESGGLALRREWLTVQEVVGSALHPLEARLRGRAVTVDVPATLPLVMMDGVAVEQVLVNLVQNAVEYTPPGSPIEVAATASAAEVTVTVSDRGPGLPAGAEGRVFEKFFRAPVGGGGGGGARTGIGLGLAICRGIVLAHGGRIEAANRPGGGAVFRFALPRTGDEPVVDSAG